MDNSYTPPPNDLGAPAKYTKWREGQDTLFWDIIDCKKRFSLHNASVGMGKSLAYITAAIATGKRVLFLTESRALEDQLQDDFSSVGLFDMRGLQNYTCRALSEGGFLESMWVKHWGRPTCDVGPCTAGVRCDLKNIGCDYFDSWRRACKEQMVSTNYAYWIAINKYSQGLGKFDILVLDEAHAADSQLVAALSVELTPKEFKELRSTPPKATSPVQNWRMWGRVQLQRVQGKLDFFATSAKIGQTADGVAVLTQDTDLPNASELKFWKRLEGKCRTISESANDWVVGTNERSGNIRLSPVWVRQYAESYIFLGIPRIVLTSATIRPKTADLLGISDYAFSEYPSTFPVDRRPLYWIPTLRLNYETQTEEMKMKNWAVRIDQIIYAYCKFGLKGIVHTVSYDNQKFILENSRFREFMYANLPGTTRNTVRQFRSAKGPAVLVSPSVGTGFDFPYFDSRFQIIAKLPFRDLRDQLLSLQAADDPGYPDYLVGQDLLQIYGRINRAPDDAGDTWIVDDHIEWFIKKPGMFPQYFLDAFRVVNSVAPDVEKLLHA